MQEVVEKSVISGHALRAAALWRIVQEAQRRQRALSRLITTDPATLDTQRIRRQRKADGRNTGERFVPRHTVWRESIVGAGFLPEIVERAAFNVAHQYWQTVHSFAALTASCIPGMNGRGHRNQQTQQQAIEQTARYGFRHHALHRRMARR
ncbi:MAG: hypothetical protein BWZ07_00182 [Alphaproteobacteria bacterium ADurb.BinA280]|nr:MAG: hypothetical protein BWZ07_00182 [Alphaproteobacteria bacterium ADurb.BinA280]